VRLFALKALTGCGETRWMKGTGFKPWDFSRPALKRMIGVQLVPGALKRSSPRMNAGAPTNFRTPRARAYAQLILQDLYVRAKYSNRIEFSHLYETEH
jgi:hypothetical protein